MASRPVAGALKRAAALPPTFFTSPAARQTNFINPRYFTSKHLIRAPTPSNSILSRRLLPFSSLINAFRSTQPPAGPGRRFFSSTASRLNTAGPNGTHLSLGQRMRQLSKEYGSSALGVYLLLTALDLPFCFLFVRYLGTEKISHYEHVIIDGFWKIMPEAIRQYRPAAIKEAHAEAAGMVVDGGQIDSLAHGEGLEGDKKAGASIWTELALAYAVHKSLIFIRVPLTAALTPKIVQKLRSWGFNIGKKGGIREGVKDARANFKERRASRNKGVDDD